MATRSIIGKLNDDESVKAIYCHWDGYPSGVGKTLQEYYTTDEKVDELLNLGDISTLGDTIESTRAYCRDVGESLNIRHYRSIKHANKEEYLYIWKDNSWAIYSSIS